ncbi:MAG: HlyD family secretion protein [Fimbriiglobus sp.]|jgi:multidrug efflux pump subunit AcrA (membrane-fusion protein)|nr:HlyD family secretion protein [Fimbriiglobus sp.]
MAAPVYTPPDPTAARHDTTALPSMKLAQTPRMVRKLVWVVVLCALVMPCVLAFVPWQQTVHGMGSAMAFDPTERTQFVVAPIEGRVKKWHVAEGQRVKSGDLLVEMLDNDQFLLERLQDEMQAIEAQLTFATGRVSEIETRITGLQSQRDVLKSIAEDTINFEDRGLEAAKANEVAAQARVIQTRFDFELNTRLFNNTRPNGEKAPLVPEQTLVASEAAYKVAQLQEKAAIEARKAAEARLEGAKKRPSEIDQSFKVSVAGDRATRNAAQESVESFKRSKLTLQSRISRQRNQNVYAPTDGTVFRILANGEEGGQLVRPGERLATIVPDIKHGPERDRQTAEQVASTFGLLSSSVLTPAPLSPQFAVDLSPPRAILSLTREDYPGIVAELFIDGNDLPLVEKGDKAILQFEGWAAIQFVSFPQAAEGTFEGRVYLVDPTANDKGDFRVLVEPDPSPDARPWPNQDLLRQGVRAQGWVLMPQRVTMGWEVWRQLNGFPPFRPPQGKKDEAGTIGPVPRRKSK